MFDLKGYLLSLEAVNLKRPFGDSTDVYFVEVEVDGRVRDEIFAVVDHQYKIDQLTIKSEVELANVLREKYETVSASTILNPKVWSTFILSGQLSDQELIDLIDHSYRLTKQGFSHLA